MADKILIVDDDPAICKLLEKVMHSNELETTTVNCGMDALSILKNHTFDLILMDIMLGDMEGFEVIKRLRNQGISTPVMIVSGRNEDYDSLYGLSLGADDYITKPFRPLVLGAKVKALIRRNKNLVLDNSDTLECGPFSYDTTTMRFYKNGDELILFPVAGFPVFADFASERIGRGPRVAVDGLSRRRCQQQEHSERQTDFD